MFELRDNTLPVISHTDEILHLALLRSSKQCCQYGGVHVCTILCHLITFHCTYIRAHKYSTVDFLMGLRLGSNIFCQHRLTGQVLFPNSKNSFIEQRPTSSVSHKSLKKQVQHLIQYRTPTIK